jgi:hypothetical protein
LLSAVLGVCSTAGEWRRALALFKCMGTVDNLKPNTATYSVLMECCAKAELDEVPDVYDAMKFAGVPEYLAYATGRERADKSLTKEKSKSLFAADVCISHELA